MSTGNVFFGGHDLGFHNVEQEMRSMVSSMMGAHRPPPLSTLRRIGYVP